MITKTTQRAFKAFALSSTALVLATTGVAFAQDGNKIDFNIPAQDLGEALTKYGVQSGTDVFFNEAEVQGKTSVVLTGEYTPQAAAKALLDGSGIPYEQSDSGMLLVGEAYIQAATQENEGARFSGSQLDNQSDGSNSAQPDEDDQSVDLDEEGDELIPDDRADASTERVVLDRVYVTGSRIKGAAVTSQTVVLNKDEIDARGFNSVEDILAALPQNVSSLNSVSTGIGGQGQPGAGVSNGQRFQGQSIANLRGLGGQNVLVLVNGRRQANSSSVEFSSLGGTSGVNLSSIPFSAIERVEILLDGASSIYGSDAIGGVINIILKKNYSGASIVARIEDGANGGDNEQIEATFGTSWDSGSVTLSGSWSQDDPINAADAGFTTFNRVAQGGIDARLSGQPADIFRASSFFVPLGRLGLNDDGTTPLSAADLAGTTGRLTTLPQLSIDDVPEFLSGENENFSAALSFEQNLMGEKLKFYTDLQYSDDTNETTDSTQALILNRFPGSRIVIPTTNAFNDTGEDLAIFARLFQESVDGLIPAATRQTGDERFGIVSGLNYQINENWSADLSFGFNQTETTYDNNILEIDLAALQVLADSSDPSVAFNPFGNGTAQNDISSAIVRATGSDSLGTPTESTIKYAQLVLEGKVMDLPGGEVRASFGGELRDEEMVFDDSFLFGSGVISQQLFAVTDPSRDLAAAFGEINVPLVGENNAMPLIYGLQVNFSGRYDSYSSEASGLGTEIDNEYNEFSPRVGVAWYPVQGLKVRANWGRAFRAPSLVQLFQAQRLDFPADAFLYYTLFGNQDPFLPAGITDPGTQAPGVDLFSGPNNNLEGETSESWSIGLDWNLALFDGAYINLNYNNTEISDQIGTTSSIISDPEIWLAGGFGPTGPDNSVIRDDAGFIVGTIRAPFNINGTTSETLDLGAGAQFNTDNGRFNFDWSAVHAIKTEQDIVGVVSRLDDSDLGLPSWSHIASMNWVKDNLGLTFVVNHTSSYDNLAGVAQILGRPATPRSVDEAGLAEKVDSFTTFDLTGRYTFDRYGTEVSLGLINLTDEDFPYYNNSRSAPFDLRQVDARGRRVFLRVKKDF
ncbi:MAG: TonB-dependent receptor [Pseudomonadota bacterium]